MSEPSAFDPLAAAAAGLEAIGARPAPENRAQRRRRRGAGAGEGKHPLGATKPLLSERKARRRKGGR